VFCKIVNKEINVNILYEDKQLLAFSDINPVSPLHLLIITKKHKTSILEMTTAELASLRLAIRKISEGTSILNAGFRLVNNFGKDGGQQVEHLHFHLLAGREHLWPPG